MLQPCLEAAGGAPEEQRAHRPLPGAPGSQAVPISAGLLPQSALKGLKGLKGFCSRARPDVPPRRPFQDECDVFFELQEEEEQNPLKSAIAFISGAPRQKSFSKCLKRWWAPCSRCLTRDQGATQGGARLKEVFLRNRDENTIKT